MVFDGQVVELRKRVESLPDDYWVVLVGDMITEEALPTYMAMLNTLDGVRDETGAAPTPWGRCASIFGDISYRFPFRGKVSSHHMYKQMRRPTLLACLGLRSRCTMLGRNVIF